MPQAELTVTVTGLDALKTAIATLPTAVEAATRPVAKRYADRIKALAAANLRARTHGRGNAAQAQQVIEDASQRQYLARSGPISGQPANLPLWLEYGWTQRDGRHHPGIYFMHDAVEAQRAACSADLAAAAIGAVRIAIEGRT